MARPAEHFVHGDGQVVVIPARVCAYLGKRAGLDDFRIEHRGTDPEVDAVLVAMRLAALTWLTSATGSTPAPEVEADAPLTVTTEEAATALGITGRAIRLAIQENRLNAQRIGNNWQIARADLEHFRAARAA